MGDVVVFLGPTLQSDEAARVLDAIYLAPAEQGSFVRAVRTYDPRAIVLVDGQFGKVPAVRHKEILWTLAQGIPVFGAASMGAIRAAELAMVGMQGFGFIYRWYALTPFADDDEVAVAMTPAEFGWKPLSEALINIRLTLSRAARCGILTSQERDLLVDLAVATHFADRNYPRLLADARSSHPGNIHAALDRLADWLPENMIDQKRQDAMGLLAELERHPELMTRISASRPFQVTEAWAHDLHKAGLFADDIIDQP